MDAPRRPRGPAPMLDARGMRLPPQQRHSPNREWRDWNDDEDDDEPSPGGQALKALGVMILFFAIGVGAAFGYYRVSAPKVVGEDAQWGSNENFAFEFGYIRGLIQSEKHLV